MTVLVDYEDAHADVNAKRQSLQSDKERLASVRGQIAALQVRIDVEWDEHWDHGMVDWDSHCPKPDCVVQALVDEQADLYTERILLERKIDADECEIAMLSQGVLM